MHGMNDQAAMQRAFALAQQAGDAGEVPVGAVIVANNQIVGEGANAPIAGRDPSAHAEIIALRAAADYLNAYRLPHTTLYVTLEPCIMCLGAMIHARVERVVFGASDPKTGACGGALSLHDHPSHNHRLIIEGGLEAERCGQLLQDFFRARR